MPAEKISLHNAKQNKLFYFVANAVVYRESDGRCLVLTGYERKSPPGQIRGDRRQAGVGADGSRASDAYERRCA